MSDGSVLNHLLEQELGRRRAARLLRRRVVVDARDAAHVVLDGRLCLNFSSNNYLGLNTHPRLIEAARRALGAGQVGAGASPLICGYGPEHAATEGAIASWKGTEAAVLLPSGYQAAHALVQTLAGALLAQGGKSNPSIRFLIDKLAHASLIDAAMASGAPLRVFPHNNFGKLRRLLAEAPPRQTQVVITESIFSMDGDSSDLPGLAELKREYPFVLVLDEAHGSGVYGPGGAGYAAELNLQHVVDVSLVTFSKAAGLAGGAICASRMFCEGVHNWGRAYIYSTAMPAMLAAAIRAALEVMRDEPWRQARVRELARRARNRLGESGLRLPAGDSPIVPILLGEAGRAMEAAEALRGEGLLVMAVRPPTVPRGSSRLRITLSCEHTDEDVERLLGLLAGFASSTPFLQR
jgi:8-amino-7-oxononanoate synthase